MLEAPKITQTETLPTAAIHLRIPKADIQRVMGPGIAELMATIAAQGIPPTGPWFTHHLTMADNTWDFRDQRAGERPGHGGRPRQAE